MKENVTVNLNLLVEKGYDIKDLHFLLSEKNKK